MLHASVSHGLTTLTAIGKVCDDHTTDANEFSDWCQWINTIQIIGAHTNDPQRQATFIDNSTSLWKLKYTGVLRTRQCVMAPSSTSMAASSFLFWVWLSSYSLAKSTTVASGWDAMLSRSSVRASISAWLKVSWHLKGQHCDQGFPQDCIQLLKHEAWKTCTRQSTHDVAMQRLNILG